MASKKITAISLFTGAGGFDVGLEDSGFEIRACVELDGDAKKTLQKNRPDWRQTKESDVELISSRQLLSEAGLRSGELDLLFGGPPCQPFSKSGFWQNGGTKGLQDPRARTLRAMLAHCRSMLPSVLLIENVEGLGYGKDAALRWIEAEIERINKATGSCYKPQILTLDAASYGVPQRRRRVFLIANREGKKIVAPPVTHAEDDPNLPGLVTAWDALWDIEEDATLRELDVSGKWSELLPSVPPGENYLYLTRRGGGTPVFGWRTRYWSFLLKLAPNRPAWTIQAQPGPATGPFHWLNRRLSIREMARLQSFPDSYNFCGSASEVRRQIGNAVPPLLSKAIGQAIRTQLLRRKPFAQGKLRPRREAPVLPPEIKARPVPKRFIPSKRRLRDHPGEGLGPRPIIRA